MGELVRAGRTWLRLAGMVAAILLATACGNSTGPGGGHQVPKLGAYTMAMSFDDPTQIGPVHLTYNGTLTVTYAAEDSIAGYYTVPAMDSATSLGFFNVDAYVLYGRIQSGSRIFSARLKRTAGGLSCKGLIVYPGLTQPSLDAACSFAGPQ